MATTPIVIIKRINAGHAGHHGGAWKVAYADFVTAMMAFFLLLWLLSTANKEQLEGISKYFTPDIGIPIETKKFIFSEDKSNSEEVTKKEEIPTQTSTKVIKEKSEDEYFQDIESNLKNLISRSQLSNSVIIENISDGISIQIIDKTVPEYFLFAPGTAELQKPAMNLLSEMVETLNYIPRYIAIAGHTTETESKLQPWELSMNRADVVRKYLLNAGLTSEHIARIISKANVEPLNAKNLRATENRRISIVLLKNTVLPYQMQNIPETN